MAAGVTYTSEEIRLLVRAVSPQGGRRYWVPTRLAAPALSEHSVAYAGAWPRAHACAGKSSGLLCCPLVSNARSLA